MNLQRERRGDRHKNICGFRLMAMANTHPLQDRLELLLSIQANIPHRLQVHPSASLGHILQNAKTNEKGKTVLRLSFLLCKSTVDYCGTPLLRIVFPLTLQALQLFHPCGKLPDRCD